MLKARYPKFEYSKARAHWAPVHEYASLWNAASSIPNVVEPYLIKVMRQVAAKLDPKKDADLIRDIDTFNKQEGQHFQQHGQYTEMLVREGYTKVPEFEQERKDEYVDWLKNRSLKYNLAYCEGFESMSAGGATPWFDPNNHYLDGCDPEAVNMWRWHIAEEFEHREVCFRAFKALYCRGLINSIVNGYFYRVWAFLVSLKHISSFQQNINKYMLEIDRAKMTPEERAESERREKEVGEDAKRRNRGIFRVFLPTYNPAHLRKPQGQDEFLRRVEPGGDLAAAT